MPIVNSVKNLPASLTSFINRGCRTAFHRAYSEFMRFTWHAREFFSAYWAGLHNARVLLAAFDRAIIIASSTGWARIGFPAPLTYSHYFGNGSPAGSAVRMFALKDSIAGIGAKNISGFTLAHPCGRTLEMLAANLTDEFNLCHVSSVAHHAQIINVYNLTVEEDHSFIANGFVVHNCGSCWAQHGTKHDVSEVLDDHHNGRCAAIPHAVGNADYQTDEINIPSGEDEFNKLSASEQERIANNAGWGAQYRAWLDGKIEFNDMTRTTTDDIYGDMRSLAPLKSLLGEDASQYYG